MDREKAKMVRSEMEKALNEMGQKHGLKFSLGTISFTDTDFSVRVRGMDSNYTTASNLMEVDWNRYKSRYPELSGIVLGQRFRSDKGDVFSIVGLKPRNRKYPVIAKRETDGKQFKFSTYAVSVSTKRTL